jgi:5-methylcytosine-specific restriction endonuclease McrA
MSRFLRSKKERDALWLAADGLCQQCGEALDRNWQADHTVAWWKTHRTNVHEMKALCRTCNQKKGGA